MERVVPTRVAQSLGHEKHAVGFWFGFGWMVGVALGVALTVCFVLLLGCWHGVSGCQWMLVAG